MTRRFSSLTGLSDAELTKLIQDGDYVAYDVLMEKYKEMLLSFTIYFVRNRQNAYDVIQNVWMLVMVEFEHGHYKEQGDFKGWLRKIARREALHWLEIERRRGMTMTRVKMSKENALVISNMHNIGNMRLAKALKALPDKAQKIIDLHFFKHMTFKEIAAALQISIENVKSSYRRAVRKLRLGMAG